MNLALHCWSHYVPRRPLDSNPEIAQWSHLIRERLNLTHQVRSAAAAALASFAGAVRSRREGLQSIELSQRIEPGLNGFSILYDMFCIMCLSGQVKLTI